MDYLSLFSGIGGFEYGIQQSRYGEELNCIGYSEVDKYADSIYSRHFPDHQGLGDVTRIRTSDLPSFELLVGGFPCQSFSNAGQRRGFDDTRGTLFFEIARILQDCRPRYFLLENVRGLLHHDQGKTFQTILRVLSDLGYDVKWEILNSKNYGVPQNRERIYIKGYLGRECGSEILSQGGDSKEVNARINLDKDSPKVVGNVNPSGRGINGNVFDPDYISPTLTTNKGEGIKCIIKDYPEDEIKIKKVGEINKHQSGQVYDVNGISPTLCSGDGGLGVRTGLYLIKGDSKQKIKIKNGTAKGYLEAEEEEDGICIGRAHSNNRRGRVQPKSCGTLDTRGSWGVYSNSRIRRLTPRECERLQGFPDHWTQFGKDGELISDTQRYKCIGNAVTTNVIKHIFDNWDLRE